MSIGIECKNVSKEVAHKRLLNDITFPILPGEFVCILGPSGSGKSTLLSLISRRRFPTTGEVSYSSNDIGGSIGYVPQEDIVPTELTVKHALFYAAKLRQLIARARVIDRVATVVDEIHLKDQQHQQIKYLSTGQRKRVSIGAELLSNPSLLFLDEPTAGLDPVTEDQIMRVFRRRHKEDGCTVVMVTHAVHTIDSDDHIVFLLPGGYLAFHGSPEQTKSYFKVSELSDVYETIKDPNKTSHQWSEDFKKYVADSATSSPTTGKDQLASNRVPLLLQIVDFFLQYPSTILQQSIILTQRYTVTTLYDAQNLVIMIAQALFVMLTVPIVFGQQVLEAAADRGDNIEAQKVLFLLAIAVVWFGTSNAAREIVKEAALYDHERHINLKLAPYIVSKFVVLTAISCIQDIPLLFPLLVLGADPQQLPQLYLCLVLGSIAGIGTGLVISAMARNADRAASLVPIALIAQIIFSGVVVDLSNNRAGQFISNFMTTKWTLHILAATVNLHKIPIRRSVPTAASITTKFAQGIEIISLFIVLALLFIVLFQTTKNHLIDR